MGIITLLASRVASVVRKNEVSLAEWNKECVAHKQQGGSYGTAQKYMCQTWEVPFNHLQARPQSRGSKQ